MYIYTESIVECQMGKIRNINYPVYLDNSSMQYCIHWKRHEGVVWGVCILWIKNITYILILQLPPWMNKLRLIISIWTRLHNTTIFIVYIIPEPILVAPFAVVGRLLTKVVRSDSTKVSSNNVVAELLNLTIPTYSPSSTTEVRKWLLAWKGYGVHYRWWPFWSYYNSTHCNWEGLQASAHDVASHRFFQHWLK